MTEEEPRRILMHECPKCRQPFAAGHPTAKHCPECGFLKRIQYARTKSVSARECRDCALRFAPLHIQDNKRCARCTPDTGTPAQCALCHEDEPLVDPRVPIGIYCAKDPACRRALLDYLVKGQAARATKFADPDAGDAAALALWRGDTPAPQPAPLAPPPERTARISGCPYTTAQLHGIVAKNPLKSKRTQELAAAALADPEHPAWTSGPNRDTTRAPA